MNGNEIITAAISADKAALMNRLHITSKQSWADSRLTFNRRAYDAAMSRHDAACNALNNVYWNDVAGICRDCKQFVITLHEAGQVLGLSRDAIQSAAAAWEDAQ
jgi:hypothetical protein